MAELHTPRSAGFRAGHDWAAGWARYATKVGNITSNPEVRGVVRHSVVSMADVDPSDLLVTFTQRPCGGKCDWETCQEGEYGDEFWCARTAELDELGIGSADQAAFFDGFIDGVREYLAGEQRR